MEQTAQLSWVAEGRCREESFKRRAGWRETRRLVQCSRLETGGHHEQPGRRPSTGEAVMNLRAGWRAAAFSKDTVNNQWSGGINTSTASSSLSPVSGQAPVGPVQSDSWEQKSRSIQITAVSPQGSVEDGGGGPREANERHRALVPPYN